MMNDKPIERVLKQLSEAGVPDEADLWPGIRASLSARAASGRAAKQGNLTMNNVLTLRRGMRALGLTSLVVFMLAFGLLLTGQGAALAAQLRQFFAPAQSSSFALPPAYSDTAAPAAGPTAVPPSFTETGCAVADVACQADAAEGATGLAAMRLPTSTGLFLRGVEVDPARQWLRLIYAAPDGGGLVLTKGYVPLDGPIWEEVPAEVVQAVKVGRHDGEYVRGTFSVGAGQALAVWDAEVPIQRLRWEKGGLLYEIASVSSDYDQAMLVALAETMP
jgi:hypothetical protein